MDDSMSNIINPDLPLTAFGDLRVAELTPVFQYSFEYTVGNTELNTNTVANDGTVTQASAMAVVGTSTTTASTACLQTKRHARYRSGLGGLLRFTGKFTSGVAATEQYLGLADEFGSSAAFKNGYMVGFDGGTFGFHRFQNDAKITVTQASWDDPLDGTGASGMTVDLLKLNVWEIRFQYLGAGAITLCIEDDSTGLFIPVHTVLYANLNTTPSVHNPNFHGTIWVNNAGTTSDLVVSSASMSYFIEGKTELEGMYQPQQSTGVQSTASITTELAVMTIRNKTTYISKTNFVDILIENIVASIEASAANNLGSVTLTKNATLGGVPSYSDINTSDSVVDMDTAGTTVTGGKHIISIPLAGKNDKFVDNLVPFTLSLAPGETLTLSGISVASATIQASLLWKELF